MDDGEIVRRLKTEIMPDPSMHKFFMQVDEVIILEDYR
jgi:hypothetical protein